MAPGDAVQDKTALDEVTELTAKDPGADGAAARARVVDRPSASTIPTTRMVARTGDVTRRAGESTRRAVRALEVGWWSLRKGWTVVISSPGVGPGLGKSPTLRSRMAARIESPVDPFLRTDRPFDCV
jgi:hypothetical protein